MNDLERDLRELLEAKSRDATVTPDASPKVLKRARWREAGTVLTAIACAAAIVVASIAGLQALNRTDTTTRPGDTQVLPVAPPGFRSVALPFASIAYPEGWTVLGFKGEHELLQLTNFDPEVAKPCFDPDAQSLPPLGAILLIERLPGTVDASDPTWPVVLSESVPDAQDCRGAQEEDFGEPVQFQARWRTESATMVATAAIGGEAPDDVRRLLFESFASLQVVQGDAPQTEELLGEANLILDSIDTRVGPVALYAYTDDFEGGSTWIGIAGPAGSHLGGAGQISRDPPLFDESVTMNLDTWGGVVWGDVSDTVARAELRTVEGLTFPATLVQLPESLVGGQVVWGVVEGPTAGRVTTLLYDAQGNVLNDSFPTGPRITIATGEDPEGGPWELYLETTSDGAGLGFTFIASGGGSGCCLQPLEGDFQLDGWGSGSDGPSNITALASDAIVRVVFEAASGVQIEGGLYPVPDETLGIPQVALVIVPKDLPLEGDLVAFDADGNEIAREYVGNTPDPSGPTAEIDAVWQSLYRARDATAAYFDRDGTFVGVTTDALIELARGPVTFASRPEPETVSVFVTDDQHLVVSSSTLAGESYCIAIAAEATDVPQGALNYRYGSLFAETYDECRGGWSELGT